MTTARLALYRHLQRFFETEVSQLFRWHRVVHLADELAVPPEGKRRHPLGKYRELVRVRFGDDRYEMEVASPNEVPPLGCVRLVVGEQDVIQGPLDPTTWEKIGAYIRNHETKACENVH